jgi:hypothetical protein
VGSELVREVELNSEKLVASFGVEKANKSLMNDCKERRLWKLLISLGKLQVSNSKLERNSQDF